MKMFQVLSLIYIKKRKGHGISFEEYALPLKFMSISFL